MWHKMDGDYTHGAVYGIPDSQESCRAAVLLVRCGTFSTTAGACEEVALVAVFQYFVDTLASSILNHTAALWLLVVMCRICRQSESIVLKPVDCM